MDKKEKIIQEYLLSKSSFRQLGKNHKVNNRGTETG
jgi:hypothetical protein